VIAGAGLANWGKATLYEFEGPDAFGALGLRDALPALAEQWSRLGAPISEVLAPGISPDEVDRLAEPYGLRVPVEAKALWEWHNGMVPSARERPYFYPGYTIGPGGYVFHSVQEALEQYVVNRETHPYSEPDWTSIYWRESWLPVMTQDAQRLYVDCQREVQGTPGTAPLRLVEWAWEGFDADIAPSIAAAVRTWTWLLEQDYYRIEDGGGFPAWQCDWEEIPLFLRQSGLA
jgi:hypothetical protein